MEYECMFSNNAAHRMVYLVDWILSKEPERLGGKRVSFNTNP